jgi:AcrR family transcriptional regulator
MIVPLYGDGMVAADTGTSGATAARRGRRLSEDRTADILDTVLDLLHEQGYDQLRMQDVADRAGVGLSTIYRRWPTKQDVVRASLECERATEKYVSTGDPRADMRSFLTRMAEDLGGDGGQTMLGFLATLRAEPEVAEVYRETSISRMHEHLRGLLAAELGDDDPDLDVRAAVGPAVLIYQSAVCGKPMDTGPFVERLTQLLFSPAEPPG